MLLLWKIYICFWSTIITTFNHKSLIICTWFQWFWPWVSGVPCCPLAGGCGPHRYHPQALRPASWLDGWMEDGGHPSCDLARSMPEGSAESAAYCCHVGIILVFRSQRQSNQIIYGFFIDMHMISMISSYDFHRVAMESLLIFRRIFKFNTSS